jgi:hypothetical protein
VFHFWIDLQVVVTLPDVVVAVAPAAAVDDVEGIKTGMDSFADEDVRRKGLCHLRTEREGARWGEIAKWRAED